MNDVMTDVMTVSVPNIAASVTDLTLTVPAIAVTVPDMSVFVCAWQKQRYLSL